MKLFSDDDLTESDKYEFVMAASWLVGIAEGMQAANDAHKTPATIPLEMFQGVGKSEDEPPVEVDGQQTIPFLGGDDVPKGAYL